MSSFLKVKLDCAGWESKTQFEVNFKYCQEKNKHLIKIYQVQFLLCQRWPWLGVGEIVGKE